MPTRSSRNSSRLPNTPARKNTCGTCEFLADSKVAEIKGMVVEYRDEVEDDKCNPHRIQYQRSEELSSPK
ncbi:hypothetical protein E2C01_051431 [Portunus trituberculatus]|uniref:Uncharacterized protein n=1 Tax=Portunus trituberculatus TaxID=210409 RepID=A0A5B7GEQ7_PORTR|nr:hypothetical protein [Portunus trituberculatus]